MRKKGKLTKKAFVVALVFAIFAFSVFVVATPISKYRPIMIDVGSELVLAGSSCNTQGGTCTTGEKKCVEDQGLRRDHACQYECVGGKWDGGTLCTFNICSGATCGAEEVSRFIIYSTSH